MEVEDHPLDYGDFEGTIPKGEYGGGTVQLWDRGFWSPEGMTAEDGLAHGDLKFTLQGERLRGSWVLVRIKNWSGGKRVNWLLIKHRDAFAHEGDDDALLAEDRSVASGRTMADIAAGPRTRADAVHRGGRPGKAAAQNARLIGVRWRLSFGRPPTVRNAPLDPASTCCPDLRCGRDS